MLIYKHLRNLKDFVNVIFTKIVKQPKKELTHKLENTTDFKFNFIPMIKNLEINYVANKVIEKIKNRNEISGILSQINNDAFMLNSEDLEKITHFRNRMLEIGDQSKLESVDRYILNELLKPLNEFIAKYPSVIKT